MEKPELVPVQVEELEPGQIIVRREAPNRPFLLEKFLGMKDEKTMRTQKCQTNDQVTYGDTLWYRYIHAAAPGIYLCPEDIAAQVRFRDEPAGVHEVPVLL